VRSEDRCKLVLVQRLGQIGNVEVGVTLISEGLELGVERFLRWWSVEVLNSRTLQQEETYSGKADFIAQVVEAADAVLGIFVVVVLDEAKAMSTSVSTVQWTRRTLSDLPLAKAGRVIDDGLGAADVTEALAPAFEHLIGGFGMKATDVDVGITADVLQSPIKRLQRRAGSWDGLRNRRLLAHKHVKAGRDAAMLSHLAHGHAVRGEDLSRRRGTLSVHAAWRTVDDSNARDLVIGGVASVRGCTRSVILVGRERITAWSDESWNLASSVTGRPSLRHRAVVLLMIAMGNVLSSHGSVKARVLLVNGSRVRVSSRVHEMVGGTPKACRHGELVASSSHDGGLGLVRVSGIVEVHALKTMSQYRHAGSRVALLRTVAAVVVGVAVASHGLAIARATLTAAVVVVATLRLSVGHA
jgi:hypothetical protein